MGLRGSWTMLYKEKSRSLQDTAMTHEQRESGRGREGEETPRKTLARGGTYARSKGRRKSDARRGRQTRGERKARRGQGVMQTQYIHEHITYASTGEVPGPAEAYK